ncbi:hypothetical protein BH11BAC2_BH11BAC2_11570 [soil metagenome]
MFWAYKEAVADVVMTASFIPPTRKGRQELKKDQIIVITKNLKNYTMDLIDLILKMLKYTPLFLLVVSAACLLYLQVREARGHGSRFKVQGSRLRK